MGEKQAGGGVLVVDDEDEILELLEEYLKVRGYRAWTATNGREALERIRTEPIDVILTDMKMPTLGGIELLETVAALPRPMSVVMMTGFGTVETAIQAMKLGAADYVLKPFKLRDIHKALISAHERVLELRRQRFDAGLRYFYEYCNGLTDRVGLNGGRPLLVEMLVDRLGMSAAGIWVESDEGFLLEHGSGAEDGLTSLSLSLDEDLQSSPENQVWVRLSLKSGAFLGVCLDEDAIRTGDAEVIHESLSGLCLALSRVSERLQ